MTFLKIDEHVIFVVLFSSDPAIDINLTKTMGWVYHY